jgi:hypothetical protein
MAMYAYPLCTNLQHHQFDSLPKSSSFIRSYKLGVDFFCLQLEMGYSRVKFNWNFFVPEVVLTIACQELVLVINPADTHHTCNTQKAKTSLQSPLLHTHPSPSAAFFAKMTIMIATPSFLHPKAVRAKCNPKMALFINKNS